MDRFLFQDKTSFKAFLQKTEPRQINFYTPKLSLGGVYELSKLFSEPIPLHIYLMQAEAKVLATTNEELEIGYQLNQSSKARACVTWIEKEERRVSQFDKEQLGILTRPTSAVTFEQNGASEYLLGNYELTRQFLDESVKEKPFETIVHADNQTSAIALNRKMAELPWMDARGRVIEHLKRYSKYRKPEEIYYLMLHHLFQKQKKHIFELDPDLSASLIWEKLFDFQRDAAITILDKLERYGGCVLADSVGLGKTYTALAVIMAYQRMGKNVAVLCPARLEENWKRFNSTSSTNPFRHSNGRPIFNYNLFRHSHLRNETWQAQSGHNLNFSLMVIDESHNFRNDSGSRYQFLQEYLNKNKNTKVLMLTATPINNRVKDLKNQLKLLWHIPNGLNRGLQYDEFRKSVSDVLEAAEDKIENWQDRYRRLNGNVSPLSHFLPPQYFDLLKRYVIARNVNVIRTDYPNFIREKGNFPDESTENATPDIAQGISIREIVAKFEELTFVVYNQLDFFNNNTAASPLLGMLKVGFLKRFESSVESARQTLDALIGNMKSVRDGIKILGEGRAQLQKMDDDAREDYVNDESDEKFNVQVTEGKTVKTTPQRVELFRKVVNNDIQKLADLKKRLDKVTPENDLKLQDLKARIRQKMTNSRVKKMLIFTAYKDTADYLYNNIEGMGYVTAVVTGGGCKGNKSGMRYITQAEILKRFAPIGQEQLNPQDPIDPIQILIATDCISEGQNLQDCDMVINYDIHWNPVRLTQRNGRINRIGSPHKEIKIVNYWPMPKIDEYLNVYTRIKTRSAIGGTITDSNLGGNVQKVDTETFFQNQQLRELQESNPALRVLARAQEIRLHDTRQFESEYRTLKDDKSQKELFKSITEAPLGVHAISLKQGNENEPSKGVFLLRKKQIDGTAEADENYKFVVLNTENKQLKRKECSDAEALLHCQRACVGNTDIPTEQETLLGGFNTELFEGALRSALKSENDYLDLDNYTLATYLIIGDVNDFTGNPRAIKITNDAPVQKEESKRQVLTPQTPPNQTTHNVKGGDDGTLQGQASKQQVPPQKTPLKQDSMIFNGEEGGIPQSQVPKQEAFTSSTSFRQATMNFSSGGNEAPQVQVSKTRSAEDYLTEGRTYYRNKSFEKAVECFLVAAEQGDADAQYNLGVCYAKGLGVAQSCEEAVEWYRKAAEQGHASAQNKLGVCHVKGDGVERSYEETVKWFRKSAEQGNAKAQYNLGVCYAKGLGVAQSYEEAVEWYRKAAEQGHAEAQYNLGLCYEEGKGVEQSYIEVSVWHCKAAEGGHKEAQIKLETRNGGLKSYKEAVRCYRKALEGNVSAQFKLGCCYANGDGVEQSWADAAKWYRLAAEEGHLASSYLLGEFYEKGLGVEQSMNDAIKWYRKAAKCGSTRARERLQELIS